jgi:ADP-heptose:LPS heptosyltransferase
VRALVVQQDHVSPPGPVGDALAARGLAVGVTGVPGEEADVRAVLAAMDAPAVDLCGRTSLGGFAALLRGAALLAGNDSGPAHLAAAVGTPSVTVFQSGDPVRWAHPGERHRVARVAVECNPCPHLECPIDHRCAQRLRVPDVLREADAALAAQPPR